MKFTLLGLMILCGFLAAGFRPVSPEERAREVIQRTESHFGIREHAELYRYVRATGDGEIYDGYMLIIFRYEKDVVNGVFRLLPDNDNKGVTLISEQHPGKIPELSVYDHNTDTGGPVKTEELHQKLGDTDWFFEGIYDDDKNPWTYRNSGVVTYRGTAADVIEANYSDKRLKNAVGYDHRRILIRQKDDLPMASEFYDRDGKLIYVIDLLSSEDFEFQGTSQARTKQLQLIDFEAGSTTVFTRIRSNWNPQLPADIFELDYAKSWDKATDDMIVAKLIRDKS